MRTLLEVREYDRISCGPDPGTGHAVLDRKDFRDLERFIRDLAGDGEHADALEFLKVGYRRDVGDFVSVSCYVGLIQLRSGCQIQVLPKICFGDDEKDSGSEQTKRVFLRMLRSMRDFPGKAFRDADLKADRMPLYEIFISMYLREVSDLVRHGIRSAYAAREDDLRFFKGKLVVNEQVRRNAAHAERFRVRYDEYMVDRAENRLVKSTLLKLRALTSSAGNARAIRQLLAAFESVSPSDNYQKDFTRVMIDRNMKDYDALMRWSGVFLLNKGFTTFSGGNNARALLFPMEKVFEAYVARQLRKELADLDWEISVQDRGRYLFDEPCSQFALRPDIVITPKEGRTIVLDTKWKSLVDNERINYGISQADMYQMYAYSKKYDSPDVWLLYPVDKEMREHVRKHGEIAFRSHDGVHVRLFFVDVAHIGESLQDLKGLLMKAAQHS